MFIAMSERQNADEHGPNLGGGTVGNFINCRANERGFKIILTLDVNGRSGY